MGRMVLQRNKMPVPLCADAENVLYGQWSRWRGQMREEGLRAGSGLDRGKASPGIGRDSRIGRCGDSEGHGGREGRNPQGAYRGDWLLEGLTQVDASLVDAKYHEGAEGELQEA